MPNSKSKNPITQNSFSDPAENITVSTLTAIAAKLDTGDIIHIEPSPSHVINVFIQGNGSYTNLDPSELMVWNLDGKSLFRSSGRMTLCLHDRLCVCVSAFWYTLFSILVYTFLPVYIFLIQQLIRFIFGMHVH